MHFQLPDDLVALQGRMREFVRSELQPHDSAIEATGQVPSSAMAGLRRMGLFGTNTPKQFGGLGLSMLGSCIAISTDRALRASSTLAPVAVQRACRCEYWPVPGRGSGHAGRPAVRRSQPECPLRQALRTGTTSSGTDNQRAAASR